MATKAIEPVQTQSGTRYKARVRVASCGKVVAQCCRTFDTLIEAETWAKRTAKLADNEGVKGLEKAKISKPLLVGDVIKMVLNNEPTASNLGKSKKANLKMLLNYPIAKVPLEKLRAKDLYEHCKLRCATVKPQTISGDISNLCTALKDGKTFFDTPYSKSEIFSEARSSLQRHGFIARSEARTRRPEPKELLKVTDALEVQQKSSNKLLPLREIVELAIETAMRRGEIAKARWGDINWQQKTLTARDRKNPRKGQRHSDMLPLSPKALQVLSNLPRGRDDEPIFPYKPDSISYAWRKLMTELNIEDLRFHDLRAEAASQLYEAGKNIVEISKITGHRDLNTLNTFYLRVGLTDKSLLAS